MINLLPPSYKQQLQREWRFRAIVIISIAVIAALIAFGLLLLSIWIYLMGLVNVQKSQLQAIEQESAQFESVKKEIVQTNRNVASLRQFYEGYSPASPALKAIASDIPEGIQLDSIQYSFLRKQGKETTVNISAQGTAAERNLLVQLRENLRRNPRVKSIDLPPSGLESGPRDVQFSVRLEIIPMPFEEHQ